MKQQIIYFLLFFNFSLIAQTIKVQPYIQDITSATVYIMWETTSGDEATVEWGLTGDLGNSTLGNSFNSSDAISKMHEVHLVGLTPDTKYFYRVKTGTAVSQTFRFRTAPSNNSEKSFKFAVVSDTQFDGGNPDKFHEINHEGILNYFSQKYGGSIEDNLSLILTTGDLVNSGNTYSEWQQYYFGPATDVLQYICNFPVPGNHESNSINFFNYFHLPDNGPTGFTEHSWYKDYSNVRFIGMDSNNEVVDYANQTQLDWLKSVLNVAAQNANIDFVVLQLHHPFKSELWTPGEIAFTGQVISLLENFSNSSGKPSFHLFGHTHAYSRGQSKDAKHIWMNVATGSGNIDYWGEFDNADYPEFSVSQDEWGFTVFDVTAGDDPKMIVKRISRGNENLHKDNIVTDSFTIHKFSKSVNKPIPLSPIEESIYLECIKLKAGSFSAPIADSKHSQSNWQVSKTKDFSSIVFESWKNYENWYFNVNTQAEDDLTDEVVNGLNNETKYWWRVRYRDREMNWSEWSDAVSFQVIGSLLSPNLLTNPGAESGISGWTIEEGTLESLANNECGCVPPNSGQKLFVVGGLCTDYAVGRASQKVDVSTFSTDIDAGNYMANFGAYMRDWEGTDLPQIKISFLNDNNNLLDESNWLSVKNPVFTFKEDKIKIPPYTRFIVYEMKGVREAGSDNDSYIDDNFLKIGKENIDCNSLNYNESGYSGIKLYPNPSNNKLFIDSDVNFKNAEIFTIEGKLVKNLGNLSTGTSIIEINDLAQGVYLFIITLESGNVYTKKFIKE